MASSGAIQLETDFDHLGWALTFIKKYLYALEDSEQRTISTRKDFFLNKIKTEKTKLMNMIDFEGAFISHNWLKSEIRTTTSQNIT